VRSIKRGTIAFYGLPNKERIELTKKRNELDIETKEGLQLLARDLHMKIDLIQRFIKDLTLVGFSGSNETRPFIMIDLPDQVPPVYRTACLNLLFRVLGIDPGIPIYFNPP